jgi:hypothetical protein
MPLLVLVNQTVQMSRPSISTAFVKRRAILFAFELALPVESRRIIESRARKDGGVYSVPATSMATLKKALLCTVMSDCPGPTSTPTR